MTTPPFVSNCTTRNGLPHARQQQHAGGSREVGRIAIRQVKLANSKKNVMVLNLIYPFGKIGAAFERFCYLRRIHGSVLREVFSVLPFEELFAILCVWFASEVTIGSSFLILWLTQGQGHCDRAWTTVELDLHDFGDIVCGEFATF